MPEPERLDPMAAIMSERLLDPAQHKFIPCDEPVCSSCGFDPDEHRPDFILPWKDPALVTKEHGDV